MSNLVSKIIGGTVILMLVCFAGAGCVCIDHAQGEMAGEPTASSIILQSRLTNGRKLVRGDMPGAAGVACFELSQNPGFRNSFKTTWTKAAAESDFIIKQKIDNLLNGTRYYYRLLYGPDIKEITSGDTCTFRTLPSPDTENKVAFVVVTGMNYHKFHHDDPQRPAYKGPDKKLGYPALKTILDMQPDFFVGTGDNVYYDSPPQKSARTQKQLRKKYHQQFVQQRFVDLFANIPTYWEKDDHDYRYNDCDNSGDVAPLPRLGRQMFLEQLPVVSPGKHRPITYRTYRVNKLLQIWLVEGRDWRSCNDMPDGPDKTIWGKTQKNWLQKTLLESTAAFKILISPTPMVGPDDDYKKDNHTNPKGFKYEGEEFFAWLGRNGFLKKNFYIICGDRHWQYHSIHPSGFEEFSCGALVEANSRIGRKPGDAESTDPQGLIKQPYIPKEATGSFLGVTVDPGRENRKPTIVFAFYDTNGTLLYKCLK